MTDSKDSKAIQKLREMVRFNIRDETCTLESIELRVAIGAAALAIAEAIDRVAAAIRERGTNTPALPNFERKATRRALDRDA